jgi:enoyl-[acyl-carrier-protein] reductase (NADH)
MSLRGKKGLIVGIANENSIAFCCAKAMHEAGAEPLMMQGGCLLTVTFYGAAFLVSDAAAALTGNVEYVDAGYHIVS